MEQGKEDGGGRRDNREGEESESGRGSIFRRPESCPGGGRGNDRWERLQTAQGWGYSWHEPQIVGKRFDVPVAAERERGGGWNVGRGGNEESQSISRSECRQGRWWHYKRIWEREVTDFVEKRRIERLCLLLSECRERKHERRRKVANHIVPRTHKARTEKCLRAEAEIVVGPSRLAG